MAFAGALCIDLARQGTATPPGAVTEAASRGAEKESFVTLAATTVELEASRDEPSPDEEHASSLGGWPLVVKPSPGKGLGVFAASPLPSGLLLGLYEGELIDDEELGARGECSDYIFDLGNGQSIDAQDETRSDWTRYINHSTRQPNIEARVRRGVAYVMVPEHATQEDGGWVDVELPPNVRVELWTKLAVGKWDELLLDYGDGYWAGRPGFTVVEKPG